MAALIDISVVIDEGDAWPNDQSAAYALHAGLLATLRRVTADQSSSGIADQPHGHRFSLAARREGRDVHLRLGLVRDAWQEPMLAGLDLLGRSTHGFRAKGRTLHISAVGPVWERTSIDLWNATPLTRLDVSFRSPTNFAVAGRHSRAVADPASIVSSWARAFSSLAEITDGDPPEVPAPCPTPVRQELERRLVPVDGTIRWTRCRVSPGPRRGALMTVAGFTGDMTLELLPDEDEQDVATWLGRLAALAPFAGTGYRPQKGFGHTEVRTTSQPSPDRGPRR